MDVSAEGGDREGPYFYASTTELASLSLTHGSQISYAGTTYTVEGMVPDGEGVSQLVVTQGQGPAA